MSWNQQIESVKLLQDSRDKLKEAAQGTKTAAYDLISDLKAAIDRKDEKYQILVENIQDGMYILKDKRFIFVNKSICDILQMSRQDILGKKMSELVDVDLIQKEFETKYDEEVKKRYTIYFKLKNTNINKIVNVRETEKWDGGFTSEMRDMGFTEEEVENSIVAIGTVKDVTSLIEKERMLHAFISIINESSDVIMVVSKHGNIMFVNTQFEHVYGYALDEVLGKNPNLLKSGFHGEDFYKNMWNTLRCGQEWRGGVFNKSKNGSIIEDETKIIPFNNGNTEPMFFMAVKRVRKILTHAEVDVLRREHSSKFSSDWDAAHTGL